MTGVYRDLDIWITKEDWEGLLRYKNAFLQNREGECEETYIDKEVLLSWKRSREAGISPNAILSAHRLSHFELKKVLEDNEILIETVKPLLRTFKYLAGLKSGFIIHLCDKNGVFLTQEGEMIQDTSEGVIWNEKTIGTCIHTICMNLKKPVQLLGLGHYNLSLKDIIGSAAPIFDESGNVIALLILGQPLEEEPWTDVSKNLRIHTLALITSLALAVEALLKLKKSNETSKVLTDTLSTVLSIIDEGIVAIDQTGRIININTEGTKMLKIKKEDIGKVNISQYMSKNSRLMNLIKEERKVDIEESLCLEDGDEHSFYINIRPIDNINISEQVAAVLKLIKIEKVNALTLNRSGSIASYTFDDIKGEDTAFKSSLALAQRFAQTPENILLLGESGTGKELYAQAIHNMYRPQGPFIAVNCAAFPRELIESELFGYEGGSFTGAERSGRPGKIELANGGTLFLDEIGDLPLEIQAVLLRTLEDKQVIRIGGKRYKKVDFRLIAATNKDLMKMVKENQYREDLYFRLSVLTINIPPLRKRSNDIEILSNLFIENYCKKQGKQILRLSPVVLKKLKKYTWPGNIRELKNAIIYAVNTVKDDYINLENLPQYLMESECICIKEINSGKFNIENLEKVVIGEALLQANNNLGSAADLLGFSRSTLYRKIKEYDIKY